MPEGGLDPSLEPSDQLFATPVSQTTSGHHGCEIIFAELTVAQRADHYGVGYGRSELLNEVQGKSQLVAGT